MPGYSKGIPLHCHLLLIAVYRIAGARHKECLHVLVLYLSHFIAKTGLLCKERNCTKHGEAYYKGGGQLNHHAKEIYSVNANQ